MIRVNLLSSKPGAAMPRRDWFPADQRLAAMGLGLLFLTASVMGLWWWQVERERSAVDVTIVAAEADLIRLRDVAALVEKAILRKADLAQRVGLIDRLRAAERGPVQLLMGLSRSLTDGLWLLDMTQKGPMVLIEGRATSNNAISDFVLRMQESGLFKLPVEIVMTNMEPLEDISVFRFSVKAEVLPPPAIEPPPTGKANSPSGH